MITPPELSEKVPLLIPQSRGFTDENKTGFWRFVRPCYENKTAPCSTACPAGEDISRIEMLASRGLFKQAWETILQENPFPAVCGRVCFHPCENSCNRKELDQAVSINRLERFLADTAFQDGSVPALTNLPPNGKSIAVIGAGPAGLSAAWFLSRLGYTCDVYEATSSPGGLLRWGIPGYRLPEGVLNNEIQRIRNQGVNIICNQPITRKFLTESKEKYDAFFIGCGHGRSLMMNIPGEDMAVDGMAFLSDIRNGSAQSVHGEVAVIGGGNSAIDVARSLIRLGARPVLIYRRRKQDMPAFDHEIEMAVKEGVQIQELLSPVHIESLRDDFVLTLQKMKISDTDTDGRARVIPAQEKSRTMRFKKIFSAIGSEVQEPWRFPPRKHDKSLLHLSHCIIHHQDLPIVYGGDLTNEVKSVTDAVASGKQAAMALDILFKDGRDVIEDKLATCRIGNSASLSMEIYLGGDRKLRTPHVVTYNEINPDYFTPSARADHPRLPIKDGIKSFEETDHTLPLPVALQEAQRCFNCGICNDCDNCRIFCPEVAVTVGKNGRSINMDYCKGCGICVEECPRNAMVIEEENL
ncbi:MAG: FAD-dependent oxidoreductase [Desulfobacterales bacterium]|nr:FAD-dependent oxidoreductase [Desulfobacterales bacterium]MDD4392658.1 FAD-dependent oxidoreductase [Desulfobacterales bacterium]